LSFNGRNPLERDWKENRISVYGIKYNSSDYSKSDCQIGYGVINIALLPVLFIKNIDVCFDFV
jgi:hypothetical protein